jgi:hypothetical protein
MNVGFRNSSRSTVPINALNYITPTALHDVRYTHIFVSGIIKREGQCDKECPPDILNWYLGFRAECELTHTVDGFGGLVVASGSRVRGFKPGRSRWIFNEC